jgi:putative hydrolase of HD superfamily
VADHSWGTALLCLVYADEAQVDASRAVEIAVVHDLAEAITGDIARRVDTDAQTRSDTEKARLEAEAMDRLIEGWDGRRVQDLWLEYEQKSSPEALFVRDMNLLDMCLQALKYEQNRRYEPEAPNANFPDFPRLDEFFATSQPRFSTAVGRRMFQDVKARYETVRDSARGD